MPSLQRFCQFIWVLGSVHSWTSRIVSSPLRQQHQTQQQQQQQHSTHNEVQYHRQQQQHYYNRCAFSSSLKASSSSSNDGDDEYEFKHTLAILSMPSTSTDKIANEAILNKAVQHTNKLSVVLRAQGRNPSLARLRRYVGEVYSTLWDVAMSSVDGREREFCDVVVYPQNLPNAAPEQWIHHAPDLDSVCSHDSICGWVSEGALGRGLQFQSQLGNGVGGLDDHVEALNADRARRNLSAVKAIHVDPWPLGASAERQAENNVEFLDDEDFEEETAKKEVSSNQANGAQAEDDEDEEGAGCSLIGGARIPTECLFEKVAVGGTFDGMHYGHRKLLTLAVSSVNPASGGIMIGVTVDEMLRNKAYADQIPNLKERIDGAREFVYRLAPGLKNRIRLRAISDAYGPPGTKEHGADFDALVLSHETLDNGCDLNRHRVENLGLEPLVLLCTRRTEPHGMSSTALRRRRAQQTEREQSEASR